MNYPLFVQPSVYLHNLCPAQNSHCAFCLILLWTQDQIRLKDLWTCFWSLLLCAVMVLKIPISIKSDAMFVSTWRLYSPFIIPFLIFKFFMQTWTQFSWCYTGKGCFFFSFWSWLIYLFFLIQSWNMFVDMICLMPTVWCVDQTTVFF